MKYLLLLLLLSCAEKNLNKPSITSLPNGEQCYRGHVYYPYGPHSVYPAFGSNGKPLKCEDVK